MEGGRRFQNVRIPSVQVKVLVTVNFYVKPKGTYTFVLLSKSDSPGLFSPVVDVLDTDFLRIFSLRGTSVTATSTVVFLTSFSFSVSF